jgi:hypothetical protein
LNTPSGNPASFRRPASTSACGRIALRGLQHERVAADERHREHPQRHHRGEVERRDPGDDAKRLTERVSIDSGAHVLGELALEELRRAARVLDDVDAAGELAGRIGQDLAVLARDHGDDLVGALLEQRLEAEHDPRPGEWGGGGPGGERGLRRLDRAADFGRGRERNTRAERAGGGGVDVAEAAGISGRTLAADPVGERGDIGLAQCGRGGHGSISGSRRRHGMAQGARVGTDA